MELLTLFTYHVKLVFVNKFVQLSDKMHFSNAHHFPSHPSRDSKCRHTFSADVGTFAPVCSALIFVSTWNQHEFFSNCGVWTSKRFFCWRQVHFQYQSHFGQPNGIYYFGTVASSLHLMAPSSPFRQDNEPKKC